MHIRPASAVDARSLSELLNEIIALGGTTALKTLTKADMISWIVSNPAEYAFLIAEDERGEPDEGGDAEEAGGPASGADRRCRRHVSSSLVMSLPTRRRKPMLPAPR